MYIYMYIYIYIKVSTVALKIPNCFGKVRSARGERLACSERA